MKITKVIKQYKNNRNGCQERVKKEGSKLYISSDVGMGFMDWMQVSESQLKNALEWTLAPSEIAEELIG